MKTDAAISAAVKDFATKIRHGDDVHRAWLTEAADAYVNGFDLPAPRSLPITDEAVNEAWSELESELDIGYITDGKIYECGQCGGKNKKHEEGCIVPAWEKVSELNLKMFQQLREQLAAKEELRVVLERHHKKQLAAEQEKVQPLVDALKLALKHINPMAPASVEEKIDAELAKVKEGK